MGIGQFLNRDNPFFAPSGTIRAILALCAIFTFCLGFLKGLIDTQAFVVVVGAIVTHYFKGGPPQQGQTQPAGG